MKTKLKRLDISVFKEKSFEIPTAFEKKISGIKIPINNYSISLKNIPFLTIQVKKKSKEFAEVYLSGYFMFNVAKQAIKDYIDENMETKLISI